MTEGKYPFGKEIEQLGVLSDRDRMLSYWVRQFQIVMIRIRKRTVAWAIENLTKDEAPVSVLSFSLPLKALLIRDFRIFYIQAYQLGSGYGNRLPVGGLRLKADMASAVFIIRIERDLKDQWRRLNTKNRAIITKVTEEVFQNVIH